MNDYSELKRLAQYCSIARTGGWRGKMGVDENQILILLEQIEAQQARIIELAQAANAARDEADRLREEVKVHIATNANLGQMVKARIREEDVIRKDAARYRWLRDRASSSDWEFAGYQTSKDAHIDSEIAKETPSV